MRETHTVPGHVLAVPLDARSCWDSLIYLYIITSDMYIHVYNGETEEEEGKRKKEKKIQCTFGVYFYKGRVTHRVTRPYHIQSTGGLSPVSWRKGLLPLARG
jgi:hypothetical protein